MVPKSPACATSLNVFPEFWLAPPAEWGRALRLLCINRNARTRRLSTAIHLSPAGPAGGRRATVAGPARRAGRPAGPAWLMGRLPLLTLELFATFTELYPSTAERVHPRRLGRRFCLSALLGFSAGCQTSCVVYEGFSAGCQTSCVVYASLPTACDLWVGNCRDPKTSQVGPAILPP